jgi:lysyl-tRNA synthetase class II
VFRNEGANSRGNPKFTSVEKHQRLLHFTPTALMSHLLFAGVP